jgi:ribose transport system permease protein
MGSGPRPRGARLQQAPLGVAVLVLVGLLVAYLILYGRELGRLPGDFESTSLTNTTLPLVFAAVGQGVVVLTRGIDLSVGGMMDVTNSLAAVHLRADTGAGAMLGWSLLILAVGAGGGVAGGLLIAYARLPSILVTLAMLSIYQGVALRILPEPGGAVPPAFSAALASPVRPTGLLLVVLVAAGWFVFRRTRFGVGILALGNDPVAARANGLPVQRLIIGAHLLSGTCAAAGGLLMAATRTGGDATAGNVYTLTSIAAVVVGGISLLGGQGSIVGAVCGAFALTLIENVLFFARIEPLYTPFYQGLFLVVAMLIGGAARSLAQRPPRHGRPLGSRS